MQIVQAKSELGQVEARCLMSVEDPPVAPAAKSSRVDAGAWSVISKQSGRIFLCNQGGTTD